MGKKRSSVFRSYLGKIKNEFKRCPVCSKPLHSNNKSGLCSADSNREMSLCRRSQNTGGTK